MSNFQNVLIVGSNQLADSLHNTFHGSTWVDSTKDLPLNSLHSFSYIFETEHSNLAKKQKNIQALEESFENTSAIIITCVLSVSCTEVSSWTNGKISLVGFACFSDLTSKKLIELTIPLNGSRINLQTVTTLFNHNELETEFVEDQAGLVFPRVLSMIINEAFYAFTQNIASKEDIDIAMKLGTNYPRGPLEWAERVGLDEIYSVLSGLHLNLQEERYRPAPLLKKFVQSGWYNQAFSCYEKYKEQVKLKI